MRRDSYRQQIAAIALLVVTLAGAWKICGRRIVHRMDALGERVSIAVSWRMNG